MNYSKIKWSDVSSGPGVRVSIYVSGCTHNCKGCFNSETHNFNHGTPWSKEIEDKIIDRLNKLSISGINMLGGDPLQQIMDTQLLDFLTRVKRETGKSIWLWTGYELEDILSKDNMQKSIIELCDVVIDGKYVQELSDPTLRYMGSKNQRIIDVKKTMESKEIRELE